SPSEILTHVVPEDRDKLLRAIEETWRSKGVLDVEYRVQCGGTVKSIREYGEIIYGADGKASHICGFCRDVTARKEIENKLRRQVQILDQLRETVIVADLDGRVIDCNKYAEIQLGRTRNEILGQYNLGLSPHRETSA
ncbi:MAG: hypothetical protein CUN54_10105, partial [Phototrophicales bacterium]